MRDHFLAAHADAVVVNRHRFRLGIGFDDDLETVVFADQLRIAQRFKSKPVDGIRCVGNQLPQKNFFVGIKRMDHQFQHLSGFGLELECFDVRAHRYTSKWKCSRKSRVEATRHVWSVTRRALYRLLGGGRR